MCVRFLEQHTSYIGSALCAKTIDHLDDMFDGIRRGGGVALWHSTHRKVNYPHLAIIWASLRHLTPAQIVPIMMSVCVGMGTLRQRFGDCSIETPNKLS